MNTQEIINQLKKHLSVAERYHKYATEKGLEDMSQFFGGEINGLKLAIVVLELSEYKEAE